jgi:hypothetical protein
MFCCQPNGVVRLPFPVFCLQAVFAAADSTGKATPNPIPASKACHACNDCSGQTAGQTAAASLAGSGLKAGNLQWLTCMQS